MQKKILFYIIFFASMLLAFWYFLFRDNNFWKTQLPVLSYVKPFAFTTQDNQVFTEKNLEGKVWVVEYFFTTCRGICPRMNANMKKLYEEFKGETNFKILSHTCDPANDSVPRLKYYADSMQVNTNRWVFVTGRKDSLYQVARNSYLLDDPKNSLEKIEDQFIHTQFFALVDAKGQVRGQIYDGLKDNELQQLRKDIKILLKEIN